jgi:hypothetical protein
VDEGGATAAALDEGGGRKGHGELSKARRARTQRASRGGRPLGFVFIAPAETQRPREKVGAVSRIKFSYLTVSPKLVGAGRVAVPHIVTIRHVAHYHTNLASPPKKTRPANGQGRDPRTDIPRYLGNELRARYESRGSASWPSTRVRQLPSSDRVRDDQGCARTWLGLKPRSRGTPRHIRGRRRRST